MFILIISSVYLLGCAYVFCRGLQAFDSSQGKIVFSIVFWLISLLFFAGQIIERSNFSSQPWVSGISFVYSVWLAVLLYAFLAVLCIDLVRLVNHFLHFIPENIFTPKNLFAGVSVLVGLFVLAGAINAAFPRVREIELTINKPCERKEIRLALVSDVHMGFIFGNSRTARMVREINTLKPDLVVFAGDVVDHNPTPVMHNDMGKHFAHIDAPLGVFAVTGNHEYIGNVTASTTYLAQYGVRYLHDSVAEVSCLQLAGRDDRSKMRPTCTVCKPRLSMDKLLANTDPAKPLILIDHQPVEYDLAEKLGVDLMLSGHTHHGQLFPFKWITEKVYHLSNSDNLMSRGASRFIISSGYGTWGPPVRLGNRPEIVLVKLRFAE